MRMTHLNRDRQQAADRFEIQQKQSGDQRIVPPDEPTEDPHRPHRLNRQDMQKLMPETPDPDDPTNP